MLVKILYVTLIVYASYRCIPFLYHHLPYTTEAVDKLVMAMKNDTMDFLLKHNILASLKKLINELDYPTTTTRVP